jgi:hypothetical protein
MSDRHDHNHLVSNPLDLLFDDNYLSQAVADETEFGGSIGAGLDWGSRMGNLLADLTLLGRMTILRVSLNREARLIIEGWNLGTGTGMACDAIRACIREKLISPSAAAIPHLEAILQQDDLYTQEYISNRYVLRSLLGILLTEADWEMIKAKSCKFNNYRIYDNY